MAAAQEPAPPTVPGGVDPTALEVTDPAPVVEVVPEDPALGAPGRDAPSVAPGGGQPAAGAPTDAAGGETGPTEPPPTEPVEAPTEPVEAPTEPAPAPWPVDPPAEGPAADPPAEDPPVDTPRREPAVEAPVAAPPPEPEAPVVVVPPARGAPALLGREVLPWVAVRGFLPGLLLLMLTLGFAALADALARINRRLAERGVLPEATRLGSTFARVLAAAFGLGWLAAWVPASVAPALPWIMVGGAVAVGWSARDLLQDALAWLVITLEGRIRPGQWIRGPTFRGEVRSIGPRALVLCDERGRDLVVPNRAVLQAQFSRDPVEWPVVEVRIALPATVAPERARRALREAALLAPWIARGEVEVAADPEVDGRWVVRARLLEGTWTSAFEGSLRERVDEVLRADAPNAG